VYSNTEARSDVYFLDSTQIAIPRKPLGSNFLFVVVVVVVQKCTYVTDCVTTVIKVAKVHENLLFLCLR